MKSLILEIIKNDNNWIKQIESLNIKIKIEEEYAIFNYGMDADFYNPIVKEARGIIINLVEQKVVCWPFTKWFNSHEIYAEDDLKNFDWQHCRVEEKIDGSIIKLWFDHNDLHISSNSCIDARDAYVGVDKEKSLYDLFFDSVNLKYLRFEEMNMTNTYMFELISPDNQIVVKYPYTKLYHIGTRNNITGDETLSDIGIDHPISYEFHTLEECNLAANKLNINNIVSKEGFVAVDKYWHRIKIKSPEYIMLHRASMNGGVSKSHIISMIMNYGFSVQELCDLFPSRATYLKYYDYKMTELEMHVQRIIDYARGLYVEYNQSRKAVVNQLKNNKLFYFAMKSIGNDKNACDIIKELGGKEIPYYTTSRYLKFIDDYKVKDVLK